MLKKVASGSLFLISIILISALSLDIQLYSSATVSEQLKEVVRQHLPRITSNNLNNSIRLARAKEKAVMQGFFEEFILKGMEDNYRLIKKKSLPPLEIVGQNYAHDIYNSNFLSTAKNSGAKKGSAYLASTVTDLFIAEANGLFYRIDFSAFENRPEEIVAVKIETNIFEIIQYVDFYVDSSLGVKDFLIKDDHVYVSYTNLVNSDCYSTAIMRAQLELNFLKFEKFYEPDFCVSVDNEYGEFHATQSGGKIVSFGEKKLLFSTGEFRFRDLAQSAESNFGKILEIDTGTGEPKVVSMGHRNVQGLFYDSRLQEIWSTEHGPEGGDEINLNSLGNNPSIQNYGWPIASYGEHYGVGSYGDSEARRKVDPRYIKAPLLKSHSKMGFVEPQKSYTPSIGISEIVKVDLVGKSDVFVIGAMGSNVEEGDMSIHFLAKSENSLETIVTIPLSERVRDLFLVNQMDSLLYVGETSGVIGVISLKNGK